MSSSPSPLTSPAACRDFEYDQPPVRRSAHKAGRLNDDPVDRCAHNTTPPMDWAWLDTRSDMPSPSRSANVCRELSNDQPPVRRSCHTTGAAKLAPVLRCTNTRRPPVDCRCSDTTSSRPSPVTSPISWREAVKLHPPLESVDHRVRSAVS